MATTLIPPARRGDFFDKDGNPTLRFIRWVEEVTGQTNVTSIVVETTEQELTSTGSRVSRNAARINSLELKEFEIVKTTTDLTTKEFQVVICKNIIPIIITLNPQAIEDDEVHIKRTDGEVTIIGVIDGISDWMLPDDWSLHLIFNGISWSNI